MPSEWRETTLGELCEFRSGSVFPTEFQGETEGNLPFIKVSDMELPANRYRIEAANNWVSRERARLLKANIHPAGATAFAKIGVALTYNRRRLLVRDTVVDNNMMTAIPDPNWVASEFFYYLLTTLDFNDIVSGTALPYLTQRDLEGLPVSVPSIPVQQAIARILGALDDKIELNRKMNETLEQMARAIFKACFTYPYEGLPMLMAGKPPSSFPLPLGEGGRRSSEGHVGMVDSPLGKIPKGWSVVPLGELFAVGLGGAWGQDAPTKSASTAVRCLRGIDCHELAEGGTPQVPIRWLSAGQAMDRILADGTIIVEGSGSFCGRSLLWDSAFHRVVQEPVVYSNFCKRLDAKCTVSQALVAWQQMREAYRAGEMQAFRTGTAFPNFDAHGALANLLVIRPPASVADTFAEFYSLGRRTDLMAQSRTLAAIRDALLPKLISGEIRTASDEVRSTNWERLAGEIQTTNDARRSTKREVRESNTGRSR